MKFLPFTPLIALKQLDRFLSTDAIEDCIKLALESILREMINDIKDKSRAGRWTDRTGNLRDSIFQVVLEVGETKSKDTPDGVVSVTNSERSQIIGVVVAGMEYAIFVELKDGFDVLQGTFNKWQPKIPLILSARIKACLRGKSLKGVG